MPSSQPRSSISSTTSELPMIENPQSPTSRRHPESNMKPAESKTLALHPAFYVLSWIFFSNFTILFNKWLIDNKNFRYPILLTCWHLVFATAATQLLARTTSLLDSRRTLPINGRFIIRTILPIGVLYSGSLVCSNLVYLYLSVSFIQMLKSASPVVVLFFSWLWGLTQPTKSMLVNIFVIVIGVGVASFGEISFSWIGFIYQCGGIVFEAMRLVLIQVMLSSEGLKMDPLVGLYYYAPVCAVMNAIVGLAFEAKDFKMDDFWNVGPILLILNAMVAFMLNIASVCLIGKTSGLVMTLTGILKSILLVVISVIIWNTEVSGLQALGYAIALAGLTYYSVGPEHFRNGYTAASGWAAQTWKASGLKDASPERRRCLIITGVLCLISLVTVVGIWKGPAAIKSASVTFPSLFGSE